MRERCARVTTLDELLGGVTARKPMTGGAGKPGADLERVTIDKVPHVVKYLDMTRDWTMRAAGVDGGASLELWRRGLLRELPDCFEQPIVSVARGRREPDGPEVTALLMRDVSDALVPVSDEVIPLSHHLQFLDHMAALHARFWETGPVIEVVSPTLRYLELSPSMSQREAQLSSGQLVPRLVGEGWPLFEQVAPDAAEVIMPLAHDPGPLVDALETTPQTFVHGNFKLDNLGVMPPEQLVVHSAQGLFPAEGEVAGRRATAAHVTGTSNAYDLGRTPQGRHQECWYRPWVNRGVAAGNAASQ